MTKEEVLTLSLSSKQREQAIRCFTAWERTKKASAFEALTTQAQVKSVIDDYLKKYEANKKKQQESPKKKTARDIQQLAMKLCKGKEKKLTFDELNAIIINAVDTKKRMAIAKKREELQRQLAELDAAEVELEERLAEKP